MNPVAFPKALWEADHDWNIVGNTMMSGRTVFGMTSVRSDGGGFWVASLNNIRFLNKSHTLLWRAVRQACDGGINPIVVSRRDITFAPVPDGAIAGQIQPHDDGAYFSDGGGYAQSIIDVISVGPTPLRSRQMTIKLNSVGPLVGGESFSIKHPTMGWRLYEIGTVETSDDDTALISFGPPLREDVRSGTMLEFDDPRCTMKLLTPGAMDFNTTTYPFSLASVKFYETPYL